MNPRPLYLSLGRTGDVINILPALKERFDEDGVAPSLLVGEEFAPVLEGVSYVEPVIWRGPWQDCLGAERWARTWHPEREIVNWAVYGLEYKFRRRCASFARDAWRVTGSKAPWGTLPLVFDQRNKTREDELLRRLKIRDGESIIVTSFSGTSSPFAGAASLLSTLRATFTRDRIVDISTVRAERVFDLLAVLERARVFVASDSAPVHLAAAVPTLPVVALVADQQPQWQWAPWRPQQIGRMFYSEATVAPELVAKIIVDHDTSEPQRFFHVHCHAAGMDPETARRMAVARQSWAQEAAWAKCWEEIEVPPGALRRCTRRWEGEENGAPYYLDLIKIAQDRCRPRDVIVLSNADVGIVPGFTGLVKDALIRSGAAFTHRWDYDTPIASPFLDQSQVTDGRWYPGSDCWAFTSAWWSGWGSQMPDMAMGREAGDMILRKLIKQGDGVEIAASIWHEKHPSFWEHHGRRESLPSNIRNRKLATEWLRIHGNLRWDDARKVLPC